MPRRIVVTEFVSLDGVMEAPGGDDGFVRGAWTFDFPDEARFKYKSDELMEHDALLLGRRTYQGFAAAWPERDGEFADRMNTMPKYVVSTTLGDDGLTWDNSTLIAGNVVDELKQLKESDGGDILVAGSNTLLQTLLEHDLADEYRLMVFPIVLGTGMRMFGTFDQATTLELADSKTFDSGTLVLTYRAKR